jgi:hypothetical protein
LQTVTVAAIAAVALGGAGVARADHTAADARATSAKLDAIRRAAYAPPAKPKKREAKAETKAEARADAKRDVKPESKKHKESDVDPMWSLMGHAMAIPFDAREREAHFRDLPTTPAEIDAHLRRLDAALAAKHHHR